MVCPRHLLPGGGSQGSSAQSKVRQGPASGGPMACPCPGGPSLTPQGAAGHCWDPCLLRGLGPKRRGNEEWKGAHEFRPHGGASAQPLTTGAGLRQPVGSGSFSAVLLITIGVQQKGSSQNLRHRGEWQLHPPSLLVYKPRTHPWLLFFWCSAPHPHVSAKPVDSTCKTQAESNHFSPPPLSSPGPSQLVLTCAPYRLLLAHSQSHDKSWKVTFRDSQVQPLRTLGFQHPETGV